MNYIICALTAAAGTLLVALYSFYKEKIFTFSHTNCQQPDDVSAGETMPGLVDASDQFVETDAGKDDDAFEETMQNRKNVSDVSEDVAEVLGKSVMQPFGCWQTLAILIAVFVLFLASSLYLQENASNWLNYTKLMVLNAVLITSALTDIKLRKIPNIVLLAALGVRVLIYVLELVMTPQDIVAILKNDAIGLALGFGMLFITFLISRHSIGFGDVKLFGVIGIFSGAICTYATLLFGLVLNTVAALFLMLLKKKKLKSSLPFAPAVLAGYLTAIFISVF